jgi:hypothetical protein
MPRSFCAADAGENNPGVSAEDSLGDTRQMLPRSRRRWQPEAEFTQRSQKKFYNFRTFA